MKGKLHGLAALSVTLLMTAAVEAGTPLRVPVDGATLAVGQTGRFTVYYRPRTSSRWLVWGRYSSYSQAWQAARQLQRSHRYSVQVYRG